MSAASNASAPYLECAVGIDLHMVDPWLEIDTESLLWNLDQVRSRVDGTPIMAVVKCNAYGHGAVGIATFLERAGVDQFAVVKLDEAVALREAGIKGRILNFGAFSENDAQRLIELEITQSVFSDAVEHLAAAAASSAKPAHVHIKVDTGMSRVGVPYQSAVEFVERVHGMAGVKIDGVFTTLTEEPDFDLVQIERLKSVCEAAADAGIPSGMMHAASSSGVSELVGASLDMVRPGNALYGFEQLPNLELRPTLTLKTRVTLVKRLVPGDTMGYHRARTVDQEMLLATLPIGYADGYPADAVERADVLIRGTRWPVVGFISANHTLVDVNGSDIEEGDEVVLIGTQDDATVSLEELAHRSGTSAYRLATGLSPLMPRVFLTRRS